MFRDLGFRDLGFSAPKLNKGFGSRVGNLILMGFGFRALGFRD